MEAENEAVVRRASRLPDDLGVVWSQQHNRQAIYKIVPNGSGSKVVVTLFGDDKPIGADADLRSAIQADMTKRGLYAAQKPTEQEVSDNEQETSADADSDARSPNLS